MGWELGCGEGCKKEVTHPYFSENRDGWGNKKAAEKRLIFLKQKWKTYCYFVCEFCCWFGESVVSLVKIRSSNLASILPSLYSLVN